MVGQPDAVGGLVESVAGRASERLRVDAADGSLSQPEAVRYLAAQGLLVVARKEGEFRVGLGPKLRKFRDKEGGDTND